ncbi:MAG TPA: ester cyclase [Pyrinomonadaceae bacterium]|jgi:steroid delta-isomerase-like uncharacterized protein
MSAEENKAIVRRFYEELWNQRSLDVASEIIAPDCLTHQLRSGAEAAGVPRGPAAARHHIEEWLTGFPDLRFDVEQIIAEADHVVSRSCLHATHTGPWLGLAPTGKQISIRMVVIQQIVNGKITADWVLVESLGLLQQLGLVPATEEILSTPAK